VAGILSGHGDVPQRAWMIENGYCGQRSLWTSAKISSIVKGAAAETIWEMQIWEFSH